MSYIGKIAEVVASSDVSSAEMLKEILLWRGFLVGQEPTRLFLLEGSTEVDVKNCALIAREIGVGFVPGLESGTGFETAGLRAFSTSDLVRIVFEFTDIELGMSGLMFSEAQGFFNTAYGAKVDVRDLDPGVALLVKVIPVIGCRTAFSCDGHHFGQPNRQSGREPTSLAKIEFLWPIDRMWFEWCGRRICKELSLTWPFIVATWGNRGDALHLDAESFGGMDLVEQCFRRDHWMQTFARRLMRSDVHRKIRLARPTTLEQANQMFESL